MACPTCDVIRALLLAQGVPEDVADTIADSKTVRRVDTKVKRKASAYALELGRQLEKLKSKHPRTEMTKLMKKAHRLTKKLMG